MLTLHDLDRLAQEALEHSPFPNENEAAPRFVSGIDVSDDSASSFLKRKSAWEQERQEALDTAPAVLLSHNVPIACIPRPYWDALCQAAGLYQFCPTQNGMVLFSKAFFEEKIEEKERRIIKLIVGLWLLWSAIVIIGGLWLLHFFFEWSYGAIILGILTTVVLILTSLNLVDLFYEKGRKKRRKKVLKELLEKINREQLKELLWPEKKEPKKFDKRFPVNQIPLCFIKPPTEVALLLEEVDSTSRRPICLAVSKEAFDFAGDPRKLIINAASSRDPACRHLPPSNARQYFVAATMPYRQMVIVFATFGTFPLTAEQVSAVFQETPLSMPQ